MEEKQQGNERQVNGQSLTPDQQQMPTQAEATRAQPSAATPARKRSCVGLVFTWGCICLFATGAAGLFLVTRLHWLFGHPRAAAQQSTPTTPGPWCVVQIHNPFDKLNVDFAYNWRTGSWTEKDPNPSFKAAFPHWDTGETRRLCVDLSRRDGWNRPEFQMDVDHEGTASTQIYRFTLGCTVIDNHAELETAPVRSYHLESPCTMWAREDGQERYPPVEVQHSNVFTTSFDCVQRPMSEQERRLIPKGIAVLPPNYRHPPLEPLEKRCE